MHEENEVDLRELEPKEPASRAASKMLTSLRKKPTASKAVNGLTSRGAPDRRTTKGRELSNRLKLEAGGLSPEEAISMSKDPVVVLRQKLAERVKDPVVAYAKLLTSRGVDPAEAWSVASKDVDGRGYKNALVSAAEEDEARPTDAETLAKIRSAQESLTAAQATRAMLRNADSSSRTVNEVSDTIEDAIQEGLAANGRISHSTAQQLASDGISAVDLQQIINERQIAIANDKAADEIAKAREETGKGFEAARIQREVSLRTQFAANQALGGIHAASEAIQRSVGDNLAARVDNIALRAPSPLPGAPPCHQFCSQRLITRPPPRRHHRY